MSTVGSQEPRVSSDDYIFFPYVSRHPLHTSLIERKERRKYYTDTHCKQCLSSPARHGQAFSRATSRLQDCLQQWVISPSFPVSFLILSLFVHPHSLALFYLTLSSSQSLLPLPLLSSVLCPVLVCSSSCPLGIYRSNRQSDRETRTDRQSGGCPPAGLLVH